MGFALCGWLHHRWMERRRSEHFLQHGGCAVEAQDRGLLDGVVVLVEGKGAGDALDGAKVIPAYYTNQTFRLGKVPLGLTSIITLVVTVLSMLVISSEMRGALRRGV